jgi:hypothetical protein
MRPIQVHGFMIAFDMGTCDDFHSNQHVSLPTQQLFL